MSDTLNPLDTDCVAELCCLRVGQDWDCVYMPVTVGSQVYIREWYSDGSEHAWVYIVRKKGRDHE